MTPFVPVSETMMPDFSRPMLAIDTSTAFLSLALYADGRVYSCHLNVGNRQSELILPNIRALLKQAGIGVDGLGAIAYAQGPGAFTGLRIGAAVAEGLALPFGLPLIGVPCLDAVAYQRPDQTCVLAATDARMDEVFYAWFDTQNYQRLSEYRVGKAEEIVCPLADVTVTGAGNAFALPSPPPFSGSPDMPTAALYLELAQSGRYPATDAAQASLLYVRNKIALTAAEQAARKAGG